ncbi:glycine oxidase ThiO [Phormidium tenue FACHB-1052]|uniref:Thiazole synthase n=2 Tax=Phormidium tenue TaxID=126344 RepID=A0A1U7J8R4_9CYAN|nr:glycine oxidase ThiO [Phormidium tenue]MBD2231396.1 glycine oxidase ThiO [Phormidium tenue FACHB-1052]OKH49624.1 glycine oxidase ThiO [Phormidium tenue NIES-30]
MANQGSDVLVVGGGVIGLAIALELRQQGASVTVLSRDFQQAASHAAAGMLAPQAEGLPPGPMLDLALASLALYPSWVNKLEALTGQSVGYWPCGILAPRRTVPASSSQNWLDAATLAYYQPGLSHNVQGAFWHPDEGQVDNRLLVQALRSAVIDLGVTLHEGTGAIALRQYQGRVEQVCTAHAGDFSADQVVLATGAWAHELLPLPVFPRKGEMASLRVPLGYGTPQPLQRVLFGEDIYIVPRRDGRIVLGATSQDVGFAPHNTAGGVHQLVGNAIALLPLLADFTLEETWWGYRPATPDEWPILGPGPAANLTLATGHYRNGILLTPITAQLVAQAVLGQPDPRLAAFSWQRFHTASPTPPHLPVVSPTPQAMTFTNAAPATPATLGAMSLENDPTDTPLTIAGRTFSSRLMTGTGKYDDFGVMRQSIAASGCEIVTVAVRRVQTNAPGHQGLAEALDWSKIWMLPNTAGCKTAEEAIRVARLGREMAKLLGQEDNNFVKLEVIPDAKYLLPDPIGTLEAAEQLVKEGFAVLPYINADPLLAKRLEEVGCATVMPLGSPIGSGQGIRNAANIQIIIETAKVPVVVDAGIGTPSEAAEAMEMGADALLINTAIAKAANPIAMGLAMGLATLAGRLAYRAGRIPVQGVASASSPLTGRVTE